MVFHDGRWQSAEEFAGRVETRHQSSRRRLTPRSDRRTLTSDYLASLRRRRTDEGVSVKKLAAQEGVSERAIRNRLKKAEQQAVVRVEV